MTSITTTTPSSVTSLSLNSVLQILSMFRYLDPKVPQQTAVAFLTIMDHEGETISEIGKRAGLSESSCSRNVAYLSDWHRLRKPGLDLVRADTDPMNRRTRRVRLTPKGHGLARRIRAVLNGE